MAMPAPALALVASSNDARPVFDPSGRVLSIPTRALYDRRVKDHHLALLCTLGDLDARHRDGWFEVSQAAIARFRGKGRTAITNAFSDLASWGYVEREPQIDAETGRKRANRYRLKFDADLEDDHARHRTAPPIVSAVNHVTEDDHTTDGMSLGVTYQTGYVTGSDMGLPHPNGYVIENDHTRNGMSSQVTCKIGYVITSDDSLKNLKDSEDLKEGETDQDPDHGCIGVAQLVALFEAQHRMMFGDGCRPDHERLVSEAEAFVADGLPSGLADLVIETVFGRLLVQGHTHVSSFKALFRTWSFIASRWRQAGRPMDDDGWKDLFDENRFAWRDFQAAFPRPDGLKADATRKAFDRAVRAAGGAPQIVAAAQRYRDRMQGREDRFLKTAERWLVGGFWREDLDAVASEGDPVEIDLSSVGTVSAPELVKAWPVALKDLARRFGASPVKAWLGAVDVGLGSAGRIVIKAGSKFRRDHIENLYGQHLADALSRTLGRPVTTEVKVA